MALHNKLYHTTGEFVVIDDDGGDDLGERAPMKRSFENMSEIPKYNGPRPKVLVFKADSVVENRAGICHAVHAAFRTAFPEVPMPSQDDIMEAYSYTNFWDEVLAHCGVSKAMYRAKRGQSEKAYMQAFVDNECADKLIFFSDSVRVLRAAKEHGFVLALDGVHASQTPLLVEAMRKFQTTDIFDIYLDLEGAWISRGPDAPPRPILSSDILVAYDEYLQAKGLKVEGDNSNALRRDEVMAVVGSIKGLMSLLENQEKKADGELWGCKLCYVARTEAEVLEGVSSLLDLEVEDLDELGYSLFNLPLPATAPARPVLASSSAALPSTEEVIEITDGEEEEI
ncbi:hypothetical protein B0T21DRAFT_394918 [Apiosordaria backusii]|uniref:Uncharacterized protein n=1 Tax=Apiosordaria backusii TaxID=314023 RepID=A0AA40B2P6_9PEZI|nr:hypothetical protein B0T21DRAFT_394918 [Apiosordaria backusii]